MAAPLQMPMCIFCRELIIILLEHLQLRNSSKHVIVIKQLFPSIQGIVVKKKKIESGLALSVLLLIASDDRQKLSNGNAFGTLKRYTLKLIGMSLCASKRRQANLHSQKLED